MREVSRVLLEQNELNAKADAGSIESATLATRR
jgi:hypothetical protein